MTMRLMDLGKLCSMLLIESNFTIVSNGTFMRLKRWKQLVIDGKCLNFYGGIITFHFQIYVPLK